MKTTCLYENEEFGNTVRDILLDRKIQAETVRATEVENRLKESIATGIVTEIQISEDNAIRLIGLNGKIIAEAKLNIHIPTSVKTISLNGTALNLTYTDDSSQECDLASLLAEVKGAIEAEGSRALSAEETLQGNIDNLSGTVADLAQKVEDLEQKIAELPPVSGN